jgi:DNA-binding NtrC family response regulator
MNGKTLLPLRILLVDDEKNIRTTLSVSLSDQGHTVVAVASAKEALEKLGAERFDFVLTDFRLGGPSGLDLVRQVRQLYPDLMVVVMTAYSSIENAVEVTKEGAFDYLPKPFSNAQLAHLVGKVQTLLRLKRENATLKHREFRADYFEGFNSPAVLRLEQFVNQVAPTDETVLITGESGTGKSELARIIHERSKRREGPFVTVYCTTLAESVLEAELFGHVKGAFTGAVQDKAGKLEQADGGTLFLDEIGDLSPNAQAKLLRFLQDKVIERVGGVQSIRVDARFIAATNRELPTLVASGKFREDLYFRLNMLECSVVPLRFRKDDLPVLIRRFLDEASQKQGRSSAPEIPKAVMEKLLAYSWPGNIRELKNAIERLVILSKGREMSVSDLPQNFTATRASTGSDANTFRTLEQLERDQIEAVLAKEPNFEKAAEILGITSVTLWRKRKQYGLP